MFIAGRVVVKRYIFLFFRFNDGQPKRPFRARRVAQLPATGSVIEVVETVAGCIWRGARGDRQHTERSRERETPFSGADRKEAVRDERRGGEGGVRRWYRVELTPELRLIKKKKF